MSSISIGTRIRIHFGPESESTITERWIRGSGSTIPKCGSKDPDPRQKEMDPQHWSKRWTIHSFIQFSERFTFRWLAVQDKTKRIYRPYILNCNLDTNGKITRTNRSSRTKTRPGECLCRAGLTFRWFAVQDKNPAGRMSLPSRTYF